MFQLKIDPQIIILLTRKRPYPPNFNKTPAKIIEPLKGASTCALGSHKCVKYIGILIINAITIPNQNIPTISGLRFNSAPLKNINIDPTLCP